MIVAVLLTRENGSSVMAADTEHFVRELNSTLVAHSPDKVYGVLSFYTFQDMGLGLVGDMEFIKSSDEGVPMATWLAVSLAANPPSSFVTFFHNTLAHLEAKWFPPQSHMSVLATGEVSPLIFFQFCFFTNESIDPPPPSPAPRPCSPCLSRPSMMAQNTTCSSWTA